MLKGPTEKIHRVRLSAVRDYAGTALNYVASKKFFFAQSVSICDIVNRENETHH